MPRSVRPWRCSVPFISAPTTRRDCVGCGRWVNLRQGSRGRLPSRSVLLDLESLVPCEPDGVVLKAFQLQFDGEPRLQVSSRQSTELGVVAHM